MLYKIRELSKMRFNCFHLLYDLQIFISININFPSFKVTEYISEGELFHNIKHFTRKLVQIYVAELAIVIGESLTSFRINKTKLFNTCAFFIYRISSQRWHYLSRSQKRKHSAR